MHVNLFRLFLIVVLSHVRLSLWRDALLLAVEYSQNTIIVEDDEKAHLLIEVDGDNMNSIFSVFENISKLLFSI